MKNEQKRLNRSHHQTHTRAGFPFLTDSDEGPKKKKKKKERVIGRQGVNPKQSDAVRPIPEEEKQLHKLKHGKNDTKACFKDYRGVKNLLHKTTENYGSLVMAGC